MCNVIEPSEIARLLDSYGGMLRQLARGWCDCADDCVQEAFIRLAAQYPPPDDPVAWLARVVRNEARSRERAAVRRRTHEQGAAELRRTDDADAPADAISPHQAAEALECLSVGDLEIVVLRIWGRLGYDQIAAIVDRSRSAVHRRYAAALAQLRQRLDAEHFTETRPCVNKTSD